MALSGQLAEAYSRINRPYVTLSFKDVDFMHQSDEPGVSCEDRTEFLAHCAGADAHSVYVLPVKIRAMTLQGRIETERIPCGETKKLEYTLLYFDSAYGCDCVNLRFWGRLRELFDQTIKEAKTKDITLKLPIRYKDAAGWRYETIIELYYHPGVYGTPLMNVRSTKRLCAVEIPPS